MKLRRWCRHIRVLKKPEQGEAYYWFDAQVQDWRPFTDQWQRCPVCGARDPNDRAQRRSQRLFSLFFFLIVALILLWVFGPTGS